MEIGWDWKMAGIPAIMIILLVMNLNFSVFRIILSITLKIGKRNIAEEVKDSFAVVYCNQLNNRAK